MSTFGNYLKELLKTRRIGVRELARKVDRSPQFLYQVRLGKWKPPSVEVLKKMAQALEVDTDVMLSMGGKVDDVLLRALARDPALAKELRRLIAKPKEDTICKP